MVLARSKTLAGLLIIIRCSRKLCFDSFIPVIKRDERFYKRGSDRVGYLHQYVLAKAKRKWHRFHSGNGTNLTRCNGAWIEHFSHDQFLNQLRQWGAKRLQRLWFDHKWCTIQCLSHAVLSEHLGILLMAKHINITNCGDLLNKQHIRIPHIGFVISG